MHLSFSQKGQALILITFAIIGLVGFGALAIDGSRVLSDRRHAQNAADAAAFAAALSKIKGGDLTAITTAAQNRALSNGYDDTTSLQDIIVNNPPASGQYAGNNEYIQGIVISRVNTSFARVIGRDQVTNTVEAIVRAQGFAAGGPLFNGTGLVTLKPTGADTMVISGNATVRVINSGIFNNSSSNCGMSLNGNIKVSVGTAYSIVGTICQNGNITRTGPVQQGTAVSYPPDISIPEPEITCSENGYRSGNN